MGNGFDESAVAVPSAPRSVPRWFFVRRMQSVVVGGVILTAMGVVPGVGVSLLFWYLAGGVCPTVDTALDRNHATATATITDIELMRNINTPSGHPWKVSFEFADSLANAVQAVGYTKGKSVADMGVGGQIEIEYDPANPSRARPVGGTAALLPLWAFLLVWGIFGAQIIVGLALLAAVYVLARSKRILLTHGAGADAQVLQVKRIWYIHFGSKHPYDVYYRFRDHNGRDVIGRDRTYRYAWAEALEPGDKVGVVYNPLLSSRSVLWLH